MILLILLEILGMFIIAGLIYLSVKTNLEYMIIMDVRKPCISIIGLIAVMVPIFAQTFGDMPDIKTELICVVVSIFLALIKSFIRDKNSNRKAIYKVIALQALTSISVISAIIIVVMFVTSISFL